jgi:quinone-modifying oxidoreductase subunit QmoA
VIVASGWTSYDASRIENHSYSASPDILTNLEFEELLAKKARAGKPLGRPSDGKEPASIAFVQCAGSRDEKHLGYCSAVCCSASLKHALSLSEEYPSVRTEIFYIDLRVQGRNEKILTKAEKHERIRLTKGKVGRITPDGDRYRVEAEDILMGSSRKEAFDMVVLATGLVPNQVPGSLRINPEGFYLPEQEPGLAAAGCCKRPMDVSSSVKDATAASIISMPA